ncbi:MAG: hypothetical protein QM692_05950, partial [Thermomicrobiales bacterium]
LPKRLLRFVLPASTLLAVAAFAVYLVVYVLYDVNIPAMRQGGVAATTVLPFSDYVSREAATHVLVLGGLVLVLFASPPTPWFAVVEEYDGERRPALLALAMIPLYALIMFQPLLKHFFGMRGIRPLDYAIVLLVVLAWMLLLRWVWEKQVFDRFFGYNETGATTP